MPHIQKRRYIFEQIRVNDKVILRTGLCGNVTSKVEGSEYKTHIINYTNVTGAKSCGMYEIIGLVRDEININPMGEVYYLVTK